MQESVLIAILIVFISFLCAGLIIFTVFFAIHKVYFRKEIKLINKYNQLVNGLGGINIFRIQVLANNDLGKKLDLNKYISLHKKLKDNLPVIKANIAVAELELNAFNLKVSSKYLKSIDSDLTKALKDLEVLKKAYEHYTQYGEAIESTFQNYLSIFERLQDFYNKLKYSTDFSKINDLIFSIKKTFVSLPGLSIKFDYKRTVETILDLGNKLKQLAKAIMLVFKFQVVDTYLLTTKQYNEKIIKEHNGEIARADLQTLQNLLTVFVHSYSHFIKYYRSLQLGQAQNYAVQAINAINQINQFTYIHIKTPTLISYSINEIKEQTDKIIANKEDIVNSMRDLKQYFVLEPKIIECFDVIEKDINYISKLNNIANNINYKTHLEKISAIKDLDNIGNQIAARKDEIVTAIDHIDDVLGKIIKTVTDLNDLYIYFCQLQAIVKNVAPNGKEADAIQKIIKSCLKQLDGYSKEIVSKDNPDFDRIAYELTAIVEQSQQIYKEISTTIVLKTYASKLFVYANRYKTIKSFKDDFAKANASYKAKEYDKCIDQLLKIVKAAKRYKNNKKEA